jgi:malonyl-CoA O-methyltransferase
LGIFVLANKAQIEKNFSLYAKSYDEHSVVQKQIAKKLITKLKEQFKSNPPKSILDLGCGSGTIYKEIIKQTDWEIDRFVAVDLSAQMCNLHPHDEEYNNIQVLNLDFDEYDLTWLGKFDLIISSSALQWSKDLLSILAQLKSMSSNIALNIFTSDTFRTICQITGNNSPIKSKEEIITILNKHFKNPKIEVSNYNLEFESKKDMFRYIKRSGVGSSSQRLSYKDSKRLFSSYPHHSLEFEVVTFG